MNATEKMIKAAQDLMDMGMYHIALQQVRKAGTFENAADYDGKLGGMQLDCLIGLGKLPANIRKITKVTSGYNWRKGLKAQERADRAAEAAANAF